MAIEALEVRMARLEGAYEQINERLAGVEREVAGLRTDLTAAIDAFRGEFRTELRTETGSLRSEFKTEMGNLRSELRSEIVALRSDNADIRRQIQTQFYWTLTLILGAVLFPVLRDLALTR